MQYLLTETEYEALVAEAKKVKASRTTTLQTFCTRVANELPVDWGWTEGAPKKPWGCILTNQDWYCDECPAQDVCPYTAKRWSK